MREEEEGEEMRWNVNRGEGGVAAARLLAGRHEVPVTSCQVFTGATVSEVTVECD